MKNTSIIKTIGTVIFTFLMLVTYAQIDNWRPYDQTGINIFEPEKKTDTEFEKLKVIQNVGAKILNNCTLQKLSH